MPFHVAKKGVFYVSTWVQLRSWGADYFHRNDALHPGSYPVSHQPLETTGRSEAVRRQAKVNKLTVACLCDKHYSPSGAYRAHAAPLQPAAWLLPACGHTWRSGSVTRVP